MVELVDQIASQRLPDERADALGSLDGFLAGLASLRCAPRLASLALTIWVGHLT
jgi:hypothetical protein